MHDRQPKSGAGTDQLVSCDELARHLDDPRWRIVDTRFDLFDTDAGEIAYHEAHIPGAVYAHLDRDLAGPTGPGTGRHPLPETVAWQNTVRALGISADTRVVVYDAAGGAIAARLWWMLRWAGHRRTAVLDGGWQHWQDGGFPVATGPHRVAASAFNADFANHWVVATEAEAERFAAAGMLFDARAPERFRGDIEPIDMAAGHVPGAINAPFGDNLDPTGRFRRTPELLALYRRRLAGQPAHASTTMCGSGVTACHNLLAMEIAGLGSGRLYVGSWSAWIADPARPVATGDGPYGGPEP